MASLNTLRAAQEALERAEKAAREARQARDAIVMRALAAGHTTRVVGNAIGLSNPRIVQISKRQRGES